MARIHEADDAKPASKGFKSVLDGATGFVRGVKRRIEHEFYDDERLAFNLKLARAVGLFGGAILIMRAYGDGMAV